MGSLLFAGFSRGGALRDSSGEVLSGSMDDAGDKPAGEKSRLEKSSPEKLANDKLATRFDAALRLIASGQEQSAATELLRLAHEAPASDLAPEALFEAGQLYEEHLADPEAARRAYRELTEHYPRSRLLRRAQHRLSELNTALVTGAAPLVTFQNIVRNTAEGSRERQARLVALIAERPQFALADHVLYLLADTALRLGDRPQAMQRFDELYRRFGDGTWAAQGHRLQAETLLGERRIAEARVHYRALERYPGSLFPLLAREGLLACDRAARLLKLTIAMWLLLGLLAIAVLVRAWRYLWPLPYEFIYYVPVAGLLSVASFIVRSGAVAAPIWQFALLGAALTWLGAASARRAAAKGTRRLGLLLGLLIRAVAACAVCYLIIYHHGLLEVIAETLRNGPDTEG